MISKYLGKIDMAEFGGLKNHPFLFGLFLGFTLSDKSEVCTGERYTVNVSDMFEWDSIEEKNADYDRLLKFVSNTLADAKVNFVSHLVGKPVEVEIENGRFKSFRILTEVL